MLYPERAGYLKQNETPSELVDIGTFVQYSVEGHKVCALKALKGIANGLEY